MTHISAKTFSIPLLQQGRLNPIWTGGAKMPLRVFAQYLENCVADLHETLYRSLYRSSLYRPLYRSSFEIKVYV